MYKNITSDTATNVMTGKVRKAIIQVNAALTGTIKIIDGLSGTTANVATITNPAVGDRFEYWDLSEGLRVIASGACNITASADGSNGPK